VLAKLRLLWHRWSTRRKMDRVFSRGKDPYRYAESEYEQARLGGMEEALSKGRPFRHALEIGAAEGAFTRRLAGLAGKVTALDISGVALGRAAEAVKGSPHVRLVEADVRSWEPPAGERFDAVVCGDVLYYLDKPLVQDEFRRAFQLLAGWLEPRGALLLAHGFVGEAERAVRQGYRERFQALGLELVSETVVEGRKPGDASCLLSLLRKP
jgi:SAM-dependent methyltransferase